jgi:hypothetical protein
MLALILFLSAFSLPAHAADFCAPIEAIRDRVGFCDQDALYATQAVACRDQFRALAQRRSEELRAALTAEVNSSAPSAQNKHFKTTKASYETTDTLLGLAIDTGVQARAEVDAFGDDLVAPFDWPLLAFGNFPGIKDPRVQELFRTAGCFSDPAEAIDRTKADFDKMIADLRATRVVTAQLHGRAAGRELSLADLGGIPILGSHSVSGNSSNSASDVTGTSRGRGASLTSVGSGSKLADPGFVAVGTRRAPASDITKSGAAQPRVAALSARTADSPFTTNLNPAPVAVGSKEEPETVGSVLWEPKVTGSQSRLSLAAAGGDPASGDVRAVNVMAEASTQGYAATPVAAQASPSFASPDRDLFSIVHERYRSTELFRGSAVRN